MFSYHSTRTRERSPLFNDHDDDYYSARRLVRTNSKRAYDDGDDEYDDYPYTTNSHKNKPSRALTIRQPSQLEKYNIWSRPASSSSPKHTSSRYFRSSFNNQEDDDRTVRYKYTTTRYSPSHTHTHAHAHSDDDSDREREFRLKVKATYGRPRSSHSSERKAMAWSGDMFRTREKWVDEDWETRERERERRRDSLFDDERVGEKSVRFRRMKRTKTEEWRPLSGFRR
ncbi:hypothetical protein PMIN02_004449 [Paraphaeosphaeria minitans]|uniref:Uncharacterized protein n=1 Tax=Paraphaeosphaeria minitans TaxID=565426 RepID=A0A9P6GGG0_9PLEO|nr:hypothetical protein PMIN01_06552 [Paraphaeosphaeria minitans]